MLAKLSRFLPLVFIIFISIYFTALIFQQLVAPLGGTITEHVTFAQNIIDGVPLKESQNLASLPHVAYFYLLIGLNKIGLRLVDAAILVLMMAQVLAFLISYQVYRHFLTKPVPELFLLLAASISVLIGAIYLPFFNPSPYFGAGSPNVHHNSTVILLKPIATLCFFLIISQFQEEKWKLKLILISILLFAIGILVKPTFALVFIPALGLWLLFQKRLKENILLAAIILAPSLLLLVIQYLSYYQTSEHHRGIALVFLDVWQLYTKSVPVSLLQAIAFPLVLTLSRWSAIKHRDFLVVAWLMLLIGTLQYAFISETSNGEVLYTGNWIGGYLMGLSLLYSVVILEYLEWLGEFSQMSSRQRWSFAFVSILLLIHLISGLISDYFLFSEGLLIIY